MASRALVLAIAIVLTLIADTDADHTCLYCKGAVRPRDCDTIARCGPHQSCYVDAFITPIGFTRVDVGCRDNIQCGVTPVGRRRESERSSVNTYFCNECCSGNLCNNAGCGFQGYAELGPHGPICYNCPAQLRPDGCSIIKLCDQDQVCEISVATFHVQDSVYVTQCQGSQWCKNAELALAANNHNPVVGRKRNVAGGNSCQLKCCHTDLCNTECNSSASTAPIYSQPVIQPPSTPRPQSVTNHAVDHCQPDPCTNGYCRNTHSSYTCDCFAGYSGITCNHAVDHCQPDPCTNGNCRNTPSSYTCDCFNGYSGKTCDQVSDHCQSNPCQHGGTCTHIGGYYACICHQGYQGYNCDSPVDHCQPDPCTNGNCRNTPSSYTCNCFNGYSGKTCDQDLCGTNPCHNGGTCNRAGPGSYTCSCSSCYEGLNCDVSDHCQSNPCQHGGTCTNNGGYYVCNCHQGYQGYNCDSRKCPSGWDAFGGSCYYIQHGGTMDFEGAKAVCSQRGGYIVHIDSDAESQYLTNKLSNGLYWVGITDFDLEDFWKYYDTGGRATVLHWAPNEPDDISKIHDEDCAVINAFLTSSSKLADIDCTRTDCTPVCEKR